MRTKKPAMVVYRGIFAFALIPLALLTVGSSRVSEAGGWPRKVAPVSGAAPSFVTKWGSFGSGDGQFNLPDGLGVDSSGNVYVADAGNSRIQKFTSGGAFITKWGGLGSGDGQFNIPEGVAVDSSGNVYV